MPDPSEQFEEMVREELSAGRPTGWFERVYAANAGGGTEIPWDTRTAHPLLSEWLAGEPDGDGRSALVVGCGFGDDAELLAGHGWRVTGFDISPTAIAGARERSTHPVTYEVADLLALPAAWQGAFDLVVEVFTVQALPDPPRRQAIAAIPPLLAPGGELVVILSARRDGEPPSDGPPWRISSAELGGFGAGLSTERIELLGGETERPRWRARFRRAG